MIKTEAWKNEKTKELYFSSIYKQEQEIIKFHLVYKKNKTPLGAKSFFGKFIIQQERKNIEQEYRSDEYSGFDSYNTMFCTYIEAKKKIKELKLPGEIANKAFNEYINSYAQLKF